MKNKNINKTTKKACSPKRRVCSPKIQGFTLIELLAVIAIIGIMTSVGLVSFSSLKQNTALKTTQSEVAAAIKLAQSYALQGRSTGTDRKVCGYGFRFIDSTTYQIFYYTAGSNCTLVKIRYDVESQTLKNGVRLSSPGSAYTIINFDIPSAIISGNGYNREFTFTSGTKSKTINISSTGLVTEN